MWPQSHEVALGIDHHLLDLSSASFEQAAQQVRLSRSRIALDEQPGGEQFLQIHAHGRAAVVGAHVYANGHERAFGRSSAAPASHLRLGAPGLAEFAGAA
jgi:hypothetical protein